MKLLNLFLFLFSLQCFAQFQRIEHYNHIDNKIFFFSRKENQTFDSIVNYVNKTFETKEDKVRAYYTWIALNIQYDTKRLRDLETMSIYKVNGSHNNSQNPDTVLKRKTAVCEGFCNLLNKFCKTSDIASESVVGYTKMPDGKVISNIMHVWTAVKIDSAYGLLDVTWSNGYIDEKGNYVKAFSDKYFLSKPKNFIKDHFPLDPMWQLLVHPIDRKIFNSDSMYFPENTKFNYIDSIDHYLNLPEEERNYYKYLHYYEADTSNVFCAKNLDIYINNLIAEELVSAEVYYEDYIAFHNTTLRSKPTKANFKTAREYLRACEKNHANAEKYLLRKRANTNDYRETFKKMKEVITEQKKQVKEQMDYLKKMEKKLGAK